MIFSFTVSFEAEKSVLCTKHASSKCNMNGSTCGRYMLASKARMAGRLSDNYRFARMAEKNEQR